MILGIMSDTHGIKEEIIKLIVGDLINRDAKIIIHCGDIEPQHLRAELFGHLPVVCVLTKNQLFDSNFVFSPANWCFVNSGSIENRIVNLGPLKIYTGHERSFDALTNLASTNDFIQKVNQVCDGVRLIFSGHTHHQFLIQRHNVTWVNPGAVETGCDGYEFAVVNTENGEVVFSRIPLTPISIRPSTVGIVSDTGNISERDSQFWPKLAQEFEERDARTIIFCGNLWEGDIGRPEFTDFNVYYYLLDDQKSPDSVPGNWHLIPIDRPVIDVCGHRFFVKYDLGVNLAEQSEYESSLFVRKLLKEYGRVDFVLCGVIHDTLFEEGQEITIINPGDARNHRKFAAICLPRREITFGRVRFGQNHI